jgi:NADPH-dependent glutamate synthase beta subunit-like oxidoreductase/ferredoxin
VNEHPTGKVYLNENEDFSDSQSYGRRVVTPIRYSTDPRDMGWVRQNIPCQAACPADTNVPAYIQMILDERYGRSYELNRIANVLPGTLGRVCSRPCEDVCRHGWPGNGAPVNICHLKRVAADLKPSDHRITENLFTPSGKRIAIIGAGPGGIAAAHDLSMLGHDVTIIEREDLAGGMLAYGIPAFRLPRDLLALELRNALRLGVELKAGVAVGSGDGEVPLSKLMADYDAVLMATGSMVATPLPLRDAASGEDLARGTPNVEYGLDFLMEYHRGVKKIVGKRVAVVGAGFTAFDCARVARRLGARKVTIHIRTTEEYIPVTKDEVLETRREDVKIMGLRTPVEVVTDDSGKMTGLRFVQNRLGGWRENGRREAIPIEGSDFEERCDTVLIAIGQKTINDYLDVKVETDRWDSVKIDDNFMTSVPGLFAAGDFVKGPTTVVEAVGHGREASLAMDTWLMGRERRKLVVKIEPVEQPIRNRSWDFIPPQEMPTEPVKGRFDHIEREAEHGYDKDAAHEEAKRCYLCHHKYEIDTDNCTYCRACIEVAPRNCIKLVDGVAIDEAGAYGELHEASEWDKVGAIWIDNNECIRCGACYLVCPTQCISITKNEIFLQNV